MFRRATLLTIVIAFALVVGHAHASLSIYTTPEQLASVAPLIVEGRVVETDSGLDPTTGALSTYVTLEVDVAHRGPTTLERIVLREPGGRYGELLHRIDAVPTYELGEEVFAFLEPAPDGALRTSGMFFGKYRLRRGSRTPDTAVRDLSGRGRILGRAGPVLEEVPASDLVSVAASVPLERSANGPRQRRTRGGPHTVAEAPRAWLAEPPELERVLWHRAARDSGSTPQSSPATGGSELAWSPPTPDTPLTAEFTQLSDTWPARWHQSDSSAAVSIDIERAGNPLGDGAAAAAEIGRAMAAWTDAPEARLVLQTGDSDADFTSSNPSSPTSTKPPVNIVLFGDPYDDISAPSGCSGVLAIGGYWASSWPVVAINGKEFYAATRLYVIFNSDFECYLGNPDNLAEVATHELGHGIGFGHSTEPDALMRSYAYGNRGPRLGDDDVDAVHCTYPHTLTLTAPDGGESWEAGSVQQIEWTVTTEDGGGPGVVDLEISTDGGSTWSVIRSDEPNDGSYDWTVSDLPGTHRLVRVVRHNRVDPQPEPFPSACSEDVSNAGFTITAAAPMAGSVPDGTYGAAVIVERATGDDVRVTWPASCSPEASDYAIYEGSLTALRGGTWDHTPITCSAGTDLTEVVSPQAGARYFLVAPLAGSSEGTYGLSEGALRPPSASACATREASSCS
jgi:hypothetical protein